MKCLKDMSEIKSLFVAVDPHTGCHLREATAEEIAAYYVENRVALRAFYKSVRVNSVLVDEYAGPGAWFGGAGF
jgi:hypothetical protein